MDQSPNQLGCIAEAAIALEAITLGVEVFKPISEHARADLIFGVGGQLLRVQCKSASRRGDALVVNLVSSWHAPGGYVRRPYSRDEIDYFAAHSHELNTSLLFPMELVDGQSAVQFRLAPPKNGQRAAIHFATDYTLSGAVAQLDRACGWQPQGRGFESHQLHSPGSPGVDVGAHDFRRRFGWYMERAAAGEEIRVSKRGRPYVRLLAD